MYKIDSIKEVRDDHVIITKDPIKEPTEGLGTVLFQCLQKHKDNVAEIQIETGESYTYQQLLQYSVRLALYLKPKIGPDDIISSCSNNHLDSCMPTIASLLIGAKTCALDPTLSAIETTYLLKIVPPKIIFVIPESIPMIEKALQDNNIVTEIIVFGENDKYTNYYDLINPHPEETNFKPVETQNLKETAFIYYSSGSSGLPKAICLSHYAVIGQILSTTSPPRHFDIERLNAHQLDVPVRYLFYTSLYWISGGSILMGSIMLGFTRLLTLRFEASKTWSIMAKYQPLLAMFTPIYIMELLALERPKPEDLNSLALVMTVGAALSVEKVLQFKSLFPRSDVIQSYGQTELSSITTTFNRLELDHRPFIDAKPGSVGLPVRGVTYRVVDLDTWENVGPNQKGALLLKSKFIMNGYYKNDDFEKGLSEDGWFNSGDMVYYDDDYCFYIADRIKDGFKYKGWYIATVLLEGVLMEHPSIKQAAVIGIPEEDGNHAMGVVVLKEKCEASEEEIQKYMDERVSERERLIGGVKIVESLPISVNGKVKKHELLQKYRKK